MQMQISYRELMNLLSLYEFYFDLELLTIKSNIGP